MVRALWFIYGWVAALVFVAVTLWASFR